MGFPKKFLLIFSFLIISGLFFVFSQNKIFAQECTPGETRGCNDCGIQTCQADGTWGSCVGNGKICCTSGGYFASTTKICYSESKTQYKCEPENQCQNRVLIKEQRKNRYCSGDSDECTGEWKEYEIFSEIQCEEWQMCKNGKDWTETELKCECEGKCLKAPENPRYYDNPEYPKDPFNPGEGKDPNNIFLPVKLDWDDAKGWKGGWKEDGEIKNCSKECVQSYKISFEETTKGDYSTTVDKSEYNYREDPNAGACFLKSGSTINWHIKACCNSDGTNCGPESNFQFKTNFAPELIGVVYDGTTTSDPDWNGASSTENVLLNLTLKWCQPDFKFPGAEGPMSYRLFFCQKNQSGNDVCHPLLKKNAPCNLNQCPYYLLTAESGSSSPYPPPEFPNEKYAFFTKNISYCWQVSACKDSSGVECTDFSQKWRFTTVGALRPPVLIYPSNDPTGEKPVGLPVVFSWAGSFGSASFVYQVYNDAGQMIVSGTTSSPNFSLDYPTLSLTKKYYWKVKPCWDVDAQDCEEAWAGGYFWTTGRPPKAENLKTQGLTDIFIPVNFEWENVPGAKSYRVKVWGDKLNLEKSTGEAKFYLDYPDLKQEGTYSWQVKTCARENGEVCGEWSEIKNFKTFKLSAPSNPLPKENEEIFTYQMPLSFSWGAVSGARYYRYVINYIQKSPEEASECPTGKVIDKIVSNNSDLVSLNCLGNYQWQVQACLDKNCQEAGNWSNLWNFTLSQKVPPGGGGLVPCGRDYDDPRTPWNEREPCQIKHLFLLLRNILDFLFWKVGLIILVLLATTTGIIYYLSVFSPEILGEWAAIANIKSIWKSAGIGYGIIFFAWLIINLFLALLGYKFQIFGHWWEIRF